jgi:RNA polymerase sigma-70 factor (ECF subfamily)
MGPQSSRADHSLVSKARDGEQDAREELARRAGRAAYVFALQLTRSPETASDVAQDSILRFFRHLDRFDAAQPIEPWLFGIVRNQVRDAARREKVRRTESLEIWLEAGGRVPADPDDPAAAAERHELQQQVWRGISQLSEAHREILVLRDYHGLAYRQIARILSIPDGTVMSRLHAARRRLRQMLVEEDGASTGSADARRSDR